MDHPFKRPAQLKKGDKIAIVSPSRVIQKGQLDKAFEVFKSWDLEVVCGAFLFARQGYFAGSDDERRQELQDMINDRDIKAIFCARGGYGMTRIVDELDLMPFMERPKWVVGFSDITALHLALYRSEVESIHGLMPVQFEYDGVEQSLSSLRELLFTGHFDYTLPSHPMNRTGRAEGEIIGGNLSLVVESLGTPTEIDTAGKILFLEEIDEYLYKIDRMLMQLRRAGKLNQLAGLILGDFSEMKDTQIAFGKTIYELIDDHLKGTDFPVVYDFPVGHEPRNLAIPCGRKVLLKVADQTTALNDVI